MNALVPAIIILVLAVFIVREFKFQRSNKERQKIESRKIHLELLGHMRDKLGLILSKQAKKNSRHVWLVSQDIEKLSPTNLEVFEQQLISALKSYPGEADELLIANKEAVLQNKKIREEKKARHKGHAGKSAGQTAKTIPKEQWN